MSTRHHFEGLLERYMKTVARGKRGEDGKAVPETKTTFREGFKCALIVLDVVRESTTELTPEMMNLLCSRLEELLGEKPPLPNN